MCRVFAGSDDAVMAGSATPDYLGVIDGHHRHEDIGAVAIFTDIRRLNMREILAGCVRAVMAADTVASDINVVEIRR